MTAARARRPPGRTTLRTLATYLDLSPACISVVLNRAPGSIAIPRATQERIIEAARRLRYRPNPVARTLRGSRSHTIGVLVPQISEGYESLVLTGIEDALLEAGYLYFIASHRRRADLIDDYTRVLLDRAVDGILAIDTPCRATQPVPVVSVSGHLGTKGVTNIALDHARAARLALRHLRELGHRRIAVLRGPATTADARVRWTAITRAAHALSLSIPARLAPPLTGDTASPDAGRQAVSALLARDTTFTAIFAFNDVAAIGAMGALRAAGLRVPDDVSVMGFDDVRSAAHQNPPLTTVRQPLEAMGRLAAETVVRRIERGTPAGPPKTVVVQPELVVRESTAPPPL
jgi:DNA-binding LacI/PurR family transcriptional regulator